ncbi:MAG: aldo/keto reductase, partial [Mycobacterium sp.]
IELTETHLARLDRLTPAVGGHHADAQMEWIDR